jgi:hypothetical protein
MMKRANLLNIELIGPMHDFQLATPVIRFSERDFTRTSLTTTKRETTVFASNKNSAFFRVLHITCIVGGANET